MAPHRILSRFFLFAFVGLLLASCTGKESDIIYDNPTEERYARTGGSVLGGSGGFKIFGGEDEEKPGGGGAGVGVNSFLWRASLDTISFMPLTSADPFGGVIITDWYSPAESQSERFKVNVFILGQELRADGVRASVFRQVRDATGNWVDAKVDPKTNTDLEDAILTRARQLRIASSE